MYFFLCTIWLAQITIKHPVFPCSELAEIDFTEYSFLGNKIKCTGIGEGYFLNFPALIVGGPLPDPAGGYYCSKFKYTDTRVCSASMFLVEMLFTIASFIS